MKLERKSGSEVERGLPALPSGGHGDAESRDDASLGSRQQRRSRDSLGAALPPCLTPSGLTCMTSVSPALLFFILFPFFLPFACFSPFLGLFFPIAPHVHEVLALLFQGLVWLFQAVLQRVGCHLVGTS